MSHPKVLLGDTVGLDKANVLCESRSGRYNNAKEREDDPFAFLLELAILVSGI